MGRRFSEKGRPCPVVTLFVRPDEAMFKSAGVLAQLVKGRSTQNVDNTVFNYLELVLRRGRSVVRKTE